MSMAAYLGRVCMNESWNLVFLFFFNFIWFQSPYKEIVCTEARLPFTLK